MTGDLGAQSDVTPDPVEVRVDGPALWLTLSRPDVLNSLTVDVVEQLNAGLDRAGASDEVRAVVVSGAGRAFCAGVDLKFAETVSSTNEVREILGRLFARIETFPKPVIAAVNGLATGGGLELLLACDLAFAAESARIGDGHSNYGLLPGGGATVRLPRLVGRSRALEMFYSGELYPAALVAQWGLVNHVVADDQLPTAVNRFVETVAAKSPLSLARMKGLVNASAEQTKDTGLSLELTVSALHENSHDMSEGVSAFNQKRRPKFTGS
jgi:enoyl-CoA hydratase/carnithine racemase